jgi:hypothetical protein
MEASSRISSDEKLEYLGAGVYKVSFGNCKVKLALQKSLSLQQDDAILVKSERFVITLS